MNTAGSCTSCYLTLGWGSCSQDSFACHQAKHRKLGIYSINTNTKVPSFLILATRFPIYFENSTYLQESLCVNVMEKLHNSKILWNEFSLSHSGRHLSTMEASGEEIIITFGSLILNKIRM
ncbi:uncharacterized protein LOC128292999 [Gossypium arboreum]|uniref:uncharacterized protein LOC128292999 n=1 Tax=Gossypium arboreum TaxID=29729 RepID=UPI0022F1B6F0|nr:uncharacterized protein LOC128292999 [Gossypium arboreum]